jgi:tRNA threonylcarbamoyladenosine biosynthesis protein TsaB
MKILALEFSSPQRSVAVWNEGAAVSEVIEALPGHSMRPFAMITAALQQAGLEREQIEGIAVGLGPGSYTGIRVAIAVAQGWQLARGVKTVGISSVEAVAAQAVVAGATGRCDVVIDAQRGEFYLAGYELSDRRYREAAPLRIVSRAEVESHVAGGEPLIGPEVTKWFPAGRLAFPRAADLARLAAARSDFVSGERLEPIYLRETTFVKAPPLRGFTLSA